MKWPAYPKYKSSGVAWLGDIPAEWNVKRLKYVSTVNDDELPETAPPDYELQYVDIGSVDQIEGITEIEQMIFENAPSRARRRVRHGDTIVSTVRTYLKAIATIESPPENLVVSTGFAVVRPKGISPGFLAYCLKSDYFVESIVSRSVGVSYPAINASELVEIPLPVPSEAEQRIITSFLDLEMARLDRLIDKKRTILDKLKEKRGALISLTVTQGLPPDVVAAYAAKYPGLDAKALAKRKLKPSSIDSLGEVPEDWSVASLKRTWALCEYGISESLSGEGPIKVLTMGHIQEGRVQVPEEGCLDRVSEKMLLEDRDLLFNRTNSMAHVGKVGLYRKSVGDSVTFASYLVRLRTNERIIPEYLNYLLNTHNVLELARSLALPSINQANLNPLWSNHDLLSTDSRAESDRALP